MVGGEPLNLSIPLLVVVTSVWRGIWFRGKGNECGVVELKSVMFGKI